MKRTPYLKIPGIDLTAKQYDAVYVDLLPKFGVRHPSDLVKGTFWFDQHGKRFLGVWEDGK